MLVVKSVSSFAFLERFGGKKRMRKGVRLKLDSENSREREREMGEK